MRLSETSNLRVRLAVLGLLLFASPVHAQPPNPNSGETYYLVIRAYPTDAVIHRAMASDNGNQGVIGKVDFPVLIKSEDPSQEEWQIGGGEMVKGPSGALQPANEWGYAPLLQKIQLQPPQGDLHPYSTDGKEVQVRYFPDLGYPPLQLQPASGVSNAALRFAYSLKYHWILTSMAVLSLVGAGLIGAAYRPQLLSARAVRRKELELHKKFENFDPDSDRFLNRRFTRWRTVERLGQGGMATVYRGIPMDTLNEAESVAIKVMNPELLRDMDYRRRFEREIEISRALDHPNVVRPVDWGEQQGVLFLVMEYVKGKPLRDIMPKKGYPIAKALQVAIDISSALVYAHNKGIVHRDLKPENIMVTDKGLIKVMDLGLAKRRESDNVTRTGDTFGTPAYMAPEQIAGGGALLPATDQYAMGIIIFELVLGVRPFVADDTLTLVLKHLNEPPPRVRTVAPQLPQDLDDLIDKMLAKDPSRRFTGMVEVKKQLETIRLKYE